MYFSRKNEKKEVLTYYEDGDDCGLRYDPMTVDEFYSGKDDNRDGKDFNDHEL